MKINQTIKKEIYKNLVLIRRAQEEISDRYHDGDHMKCPMHFCTGQEILPAVLGSFLKKDDTIYSHHRSHGYFLANGGSLKEMISEFHGKASGTNGGLAGSQELSCHKTNFYSGTILSGAFAMSVGDAFEKKYNKKNNFTTAVIGDGGMEEGIVFEAMNLASRYSLPVLFLCENNDYSIHSHWKDRVSVRESYLKAREFNIKSDYMETNNPEKLYKKLNNIISFIKTNSKPYFFEFSTYRFCPHVGPDNDDHYNYRDIKTLNSWIKKDPLNYFENKLTKSINNFKSYKTKTLNKINSDIDKAFIFAKKSKPLKSYKNLNYQNTYDKKVKKFYENNIDYPHIQESLIPKPY
jgi:pyruvate dehydrogenase E1 component alpha subunit